MGDVSSGVDSSPCDALARRRSDQKLSQLRAKRCEQRKGVTQPSKFKITKRTKHTSLRPGITARPSETKLIRTVHHWKSSAADSLACTMAASNAERPTLAQTLSVSKALSCSQQSKGMLVSCLRLSAGMQQTGQPRPHPSNYVCHYQGHGERMMVRKSNHNTASRHPHIARPPQMI